MAVQTPEYFVFHLLSPCAMYYTLRFIILSSIAIRYRVFRFDEFGLVLGSSLPNILYI
jgi:hypothetical protein